MYKKRKRDYENEREADKKDRKEEATEIESIKAMILAENKQNGDASVCFIELLKIITNKFRNTRNLMTKILMIHQASLMANHRLSRSATRLLKKSLRHLNKRFSQKAKNGHQVLDMF
jgi:hypothetical protein